jgi:uncharacterized protein (TIGR00297 family)
MQPLLKLLLGILFAAIIAFGAYRAKSLSRSGAIGALIEGSLIFGLGGWQWAILLMAFFISSSLLTRLFGRKKASLNEKFDKGGQRDIGQVMANGGVASVFAGLHVFFPTAAWPWVAFAASLAAVNADTWATELGVLNPTNPRLITTWRPVERGTSGAVSVYGTLAAAGGSALIASLATICTTSLHLGSLKYSPVFFFFLLLVSGLLGAIFDSLLGATIQAIYHCPQCDKETEKHPLHTCGAQTDQIRGLKWLNNDMVNLLCATLGALVGILV